MLLHVAAPPEVGCPSLRRRGLGLTTSGASVAAAAPKRLCRLRTVCSARQRRVSASRTSSEGRQRSHMHWTEEPSSRRWQRREHWWPHGSLRSQGARRGATPAAAVATVPLARSLSPSRPFSHAARHPAPTPPGSPKPPASGSSGAASSPASRPPSSSRRYGGTPAAVCCGALSGRAPPERRSSRRYLRTLLG